MKIICRCEDVTEEEIVAKIKEGYHTIDELKRIIRVTMGLCQGKGCRKHIARIISRELGIPIEKVKQPTYRPPTKPVPIKACMRKNQSAIRQFAWRMRGGPNLKQISDPETSSGQIPSK